MSGFPPGMFERGESKKSGGPPPGARRKKFGNLNLTDCLKGPILAAMITDDSKICDIFSFSLPILRGGSGPSFRKPWMWYFVNIFISEICGWLLATQQTEICGGEHLFRHV